MGIAPFSPSSAQTRTRPCYMFSSVLTIASFVFRCSSDVSTCTLCDYRCVGRVHGPRVRCSQGRARTTDQGPQQ